MDRARKIIALTLAAVFLVSITVLAAVKGLSSKLTFNGTNGFAWFYWADHTSQRGGYIQDSKNKTILRFKVSNPQKIYKKNNTRYGYYTYRFNMSKFKPGKYKLITYTPYYNWGEDYLTTTFTYPGATFLKYHSTKVIRNNNGDLMQRLYFRRNNARGKGLHFQIFNSKNQLLRTYNFKSGNSNQWFCFDWNGWAGKNAARRSPRGVYTVKYWVDGRSPSTAKFRLAL